MGTELAVETDVLVCTAGSTPSSLTVTSQIKAKATGKLIGTTGDNTLLNIGTFGTCSLLGPGPCAPVITPPATWTPGSLKVKCSGQNCILISDTLQCSVGGTISIQSPSVQNKVKGV